MGAITIEKSERTTPCNPQCRHPMCVALRTPSPQDIADAAKPAPARHDEHAPARAENQR